MTTENRLTTKYRCEECHLWHGFEHEVLTAPNPFYQKEIIYGCPNCFFPEQLQLVCDEPDCWELVSCGTPTKTGYRQTCGKHKPS